MTCYNFMFIFLIAYLLFFSFTYLDLLTVSKFIASCLLMFGFVLSSSFNKLVVFLLINTIDMDDVITFACSSFFSNIFRFFSHKIFKENFSKEKLLKLGKSKLGKKIV